MFEETIKRCVEEGIRIGRTPWSASDYVEGCVYNILNAKGECYPQESYIESQERGCREERITKGRLREIKLEDRKWKIEHCISNIRGTLKDLEMLMMEGGL